MARLIDVIVPVYNGKRHIAALLDCFRAQADCASFRLLFADDGSADGTGEEILRLAESCPFAVQVLSLRHAGVSAARNRGLEAADAPYVCFADADDRVTPDYIKTLLSAALAGEADVLLFGQQRTDGCAPLSPAGEGILPKAEPKEAALRRFFDDPTRFGAVNLLLRRDFLLHNGMRFAEGYAYYEDYHFLIRALLRAETVFYTPAPLYDYVRRPSSAMARFSAERLTCLTLLNGLSSVVSAAAPALASEYENGFLPHVYWSVLWQAALAAPDLRAFLRFAEKTGANVYMTSLFSHPDKTAAAGSLLYLCSPPAFYAAAATLGKTRSRVRRSSRPNWERLLRAVPQGPKRVLVYGMSHMPGGIESYLKTLVESEAPDSFDFLCDFKDVAYREALEAKGCRIRFIPPKSRNLPGHLLGTGKTLLLHPEYKTVYMNLLDAGGAVTALVPFVLRRKIVVHSHNGSTDKPLLHKVCKPLLALELSDAVACSRAAAAHMFTKTRAKKALLIPNAVEISRFRFDPAAREKKRAALGVSPEKTVVLFVGRLTRQKNPLFLAELAAALKDRDLPFRLLVAGDGEEKEALREQINALGLNENVTLLGLRTDIPALFSAADVFVLPSLYEGFPVVGVEAQASGLPALFSDRITRELGLTDLALFLPVDAGALLWADAVEAHKNDARKDVCAELKQAGYDAADADKLFAKLMERLR